MAINEKRTLTINVGATNLFNGFEYYTGIDNAEYITELEGWDDFAAIEINTEPKLIGQGSYIISERIGERDLSIEISLANETDIKTYLNKVKSVMFAFSILELTRTYVLNGVENRKEQLKGKISTVTWARTETTATITIGVKCYNPEMKIWVNGNTVEEIGI